MLRFSFFLINLKRRKIMDFKDVPGGTQIETMISMSGQKAWLRAVNKYGKEYADSVVETELQLFADSMNCFDDDYYQEFYADSIKIVLDK